jgi:hypothetical protein
MKFWFSGEIDVDIANSYRRVSNALEVRLNTLCAGRDYGDVIQKIAIIPMILSPKFQIGRKERRLWQHKTGSADYRLIIDFEQFKSGNDAVRQRLLLENTVHTIRDLERKVGKGFAGEALIKDIKAEFGDFENNL